ncbi:3,4-dihydroxy-2-butanone-4-phosphate synthase [Roseobacteraceae bacterium S113]
MSTFDSPGPVEITWKDAISPTEEILDDARNGRMFILIDHESRENEGDVIIPAQMATPDAINFMAKHARGLICLAMTSDRVDALGLPLMAQHNSSRHETAFTVSIEAREGVSTGISAADRALTVSTAIDPTKGAADIATPGHVFPLRARDGGVLVRAGHTEAAVDVARLAGLNPAGVICEIMNEDGTMARLPELVAFAQLHNMRIGTISDLISYRRRHDNLVREIETRDVTSQYGGDWTLRVFKDLTEGTEHVVMTKGDITTPEPVLVRTHALDVLPDVVGVGSHDGVERAMEIIAQEGRGAVCIFRNPNKPILEEEGDGPRTVREVGLGSQILSAMGLTKLILLTDAPATRYVGVDAYGLEIVDTRRISGGTAE